MTHFKSIFLHVAEGEHHGFPRILQKRKRDTEIKREIGRGKEREGAGREMEEKEVTVLRKHLMFLHFLGKFFSSNIVHKYTQHRSFCIKFSSVQFSRSVVSNSLQPHESQHTRPPCLSPTPGVHSDSRPLSQRCRPAISSSVVPFSSCLFQ